MHELTSEPARRRDRLPSYRTRYTRIIVLLGVLFGTIALAAAGYVIRVGESSAATSAHHHRGMAWLNDGLTQLGQVRRQLQDFLLTPGAKAQGPLELAVKRLHSALGHLATHDFPAPDADTETLARRLGDDAQTLHRAVQRLGEIRRDPALWLPADQVMEQRLPLNSGLVVSRQATTEEVAQTADMDTPTALPEPRPRMIDRLRQSHAELAYVQETIDPLLKTMQQRLTTLRVDLQRRAQQQVESLAGISYGLGGVLFGAMLLMLVVGILGYLSLDRLILRPIRFLAEGLEARSEDRPGITQTPPAVQETQELMTAFDRMQGEVRARERALDHLAHHDTLTGLPNRALFRRQLGQAVEAAQRHDMLVGLLFMDLDRFKQVNDSYGHAAGDQMLLEISQRLRKVFRQEDVIARLGGDEFAVLLENLHARDEMMRLAEKALSAIKRPYQFGGQMFYSGASIGIAVAPDDGSDPDRLIQLADTAMYAAKRDEGSSLRFVNEELSNAAAAQHVLENELRDAVSRHQLELHFQPVVAVDDGRLHCYESLLRWPHAEQGMLRPASFMYALADAGLCSTISDWALDQIQTSRPTTDAVLSINLSARLLHDEAFAQRLFERLDQQRPRAEQLILEITEDTLETDLKGAARVLHALKRRGVRIALDDFGTGQASLSHLRRFPFDYIKIDRSFIDGIGEVRNDEKLIQAIIRLAHALGIKVVAEGVETESQRAFLGHEGCDYIQGYLVGRPTASG